MAIQSGAKHLLLVPVHFWGHARPLAVFATRMVRMRPLIITFCVASKLYDRTKAEIHNELGPDEEVLLTRIRLIPLEEGPDVVEPAVHRDSFLTLWKKLCAGQSIPCESVDGTRQLVNIHNSPLSAVILDSFCIEIYNALHEQRTKSPVPLNLNLYSWCPVSTNIVVTVYRHNPLPIAEAIAAREGLSLDEVAIAMLASPHGNLIESPCLPTMYDHELSPQAFSFPTELLGRVFIRASTTFEQMDGLISFDIADYHPEAAIALREHYAQRNVETFFVGPLIASGSRTISALHSGNGSDELVGFLDKQLKERGQHSVIYISFGSIFWPTDPSKLVAAFEVLMQQNVPFVVARSSPMEVFPGDILEKLSECPHAFVAGWVPQQVVLEHPATGWCLTHGGHNTVLECIYSGVPMIVWPIAVDQATNAVHLTHNLNIAYELLEVRHGHGLGPIHRMPKKKLVGTIDAVRDELTDVLVQAFGEDGAAKRARLEGLQRALREAWGEKGVARTETEAMLDRLCGLHPSTFANSHVYSDRANSTKHA
ncbi:UDP-Glycosyltransferase/glycogen phosphorylase [Cubamyces sp. BRFM 1775]|nr:UDP-Glycosyltransferase/glycogen phosphorylase [Cubamyces sp. BRFM 1775]